MVSEYFVLLIKTVAFGWGGGGPFFFYKSKKCLSKNMCYTDNKKIMLCLLDVKLYCIITQVAYSLYI